MKSKLTLFRRFEKINSIFKLTLILTLLNFNANAQLSLPECDVTVPLLIVDLSSNPDSVYISPSIQRVDQCCGAASNVNFVSFFATLHPNAAMVEIGIYDGANPSGSGEYHFIDGGDLIIPGTCIAPTPAGQPVCIPPSIVGPDYKIGYGKPGNNMNQFFFRQILKPTFPEDDSTRVGCTLPLNVYGLDNITITAINSSDGPANIALYNSYLNCLDCSDPIFGPGAGAPAWIDYVIAGDQQASGACGIYQQQDTVRLYTFSELSATYAPNPAEICAGGNLNITATATGGNLDYSYVWTNSTIDTLSLIDNYTFTLEGSYTAEVSDGLVTPTCPAFDLPVSVVVSQPPTIDAGVDQTICATNPDAFLAGSSTNTSSVLWSGGLGSYSPDNTSILMVYTPTATEINAGSVTLTLASTGAGGGCINASDDVIINFSDTVYVNPTYAPIGCYAGTTTINAGESGGTAPFTYSWSTASTASSINVSAGTYSVTVTDLIGCSATASTSVSEPAPIILTMSSTNTSTDIACDGTATVAISGGVGPYTVLWSNAQTTLTATGLCYGVATVDVTDANGCTSTGSVVVNNPTCSAFSVSASNTDVSCYGDTDAQAFSFPSGGSAPYTFSWNSAPVQTTQNATGLDAGTYTITVTDNLGCIDVASITVLQPSIITNTMTHIDATSIGGNEGSATANPLGGTPGYTYTWNPTGQTTQTAVNLTANTYYVNILDANSCLKVDSVQVNEPPCNDFMLGVNPTDISCNGLSDGSAYIVIAQGTAPYSISWSSGETDVTSVSGLAAGTYTVTVTDASNCTTFETFDITEPDALSIGLVPTNVSCFRAGDGTIDLTVSGGVFPYTYDWTLATIPVATKEDLVNIEPGTYSIEVTDNNGCTVQGSIGITEPANLSASYTYSDILCNGNDDGSIDVTAVGGTLPYAYDWSGPSGFTSTGEDISNLELGLYELQVTDGNGCTLSNLLQGYVNEPDTLLIQEYTVSCPIPGDDFTIVTIDSISGGAWGDYQVSFDNGTTYQGYGDYSSSLGVNNTYNVVAMDSNGCNTPLPTAITIDPKVEITAVDFNPCIATGTTNINVTVTPQGGDSGPYEVSTDGGLTFNPAGTYVISLAVDNSYDIIIRDGKGCESVVWTILIPAPFDNVVTLLTEASCPGAADGSVELTITGGTNPYTISWTGPLGYTSPLEDISGLIAGTYNVTITDDSSCVINDMIIVTTTPDITPPVIITCGTGNQNELTDVGVCTYTLSGTAWDATATDDCLVASIIYNLTGATTGTGTTLDGISFNLGTTTVTWTVTDGSGNIATCDFDVVVSDIQLPVFTTCGPGSNQGVLADFGVCTYTYSGTGWDAVVTDNCTVSSTTYALTGATVGTGTTLDGVSFNLGTTTVTWTVIDNTGNSQTCSFDVTVTDDQLPAFTACGPGSNQNVVTDLAACTYTNSGTGWDAVVTDNCTVGSTTYALTGATVGTGTTLDGISFNLGTTTVTWTVTDNSGNSDVCSFDVIVTDTQLPIISACGPSSNQNVDSDFGVCTYTNTGIGWDAIATDNCTVTSNTYNLTGATLGTGTTLNGVSFNLGTTTVTWTVIDNTGNTSTCSFDVIVSDVQLPIITSCGGSIVEFVYTDLGACTYTQTGTAWDAIATDNCTISTITYALTGATTGTGTTLVGISFNLGVTTVTWTVTDGSGNIATCDFDVVVSDIQLPVFTTCGPGSNQGVLADFGVCTYTYSGTGWDAVVTDNCTVSSTTYALTGATTGTGTTLDGVSFNLGTTTVTWTVIDNTGNSQTCSFDVTVTDDQLPAFTACGPGSNQNVVTDLAACTYTNSGTGWDAVVTDNCTVSSTTYTLTGATLGTGTTLDGVSFNLGTTTVTWTVTDNSGNSDVCSFDVIVTDTQLPEISSCGPSGNQIVNADLGVCTYTYSGTGWNASATDNCTVSSTIYTLTGATTGTGTTLNAVSFNLGITNVTWTVTDNSGNTSTCSFTVTVIDDQLPAITSCGAVGTQNVDTDLGVCTYTQTGTGWDATAIDNCTVSTIIYVLTGATTGTGITLDGVTFAQGITTVTWTATDGSGNLITCQFDVVVSDNEVPSISGCLTDINVNNDNGNCGALVTWTPPTFTDNCGATMTSSHNSGDTFPIGTTTVTYTVIDNAGNVSTCIFNVIVTDSELPQLTCQANVESCDPVVTFIIPTATDNCGIVSITQTTGLASGSSFPVGNTTITFEALDVNGNVNTCSFDIIIHPTPILNTVATDVSCFASGDGAIDLTVSNGSVPYTFAWSNTETTEDISSLTPGTYGVTVTDVYGCSASTTETITEPDQLFLSQEITPVSCFGGNDGSIDITIVGGTLPYTFTWSNSATSEDVSTLTVGAYDVLVTDGNGCQVTGNFIITEPTAIDIVGVVTSATCNAANGSINVLVTGGTTPYAYLWSDGSTNLNLTNVVGADYTLTVTDDNGCVATFTDSVQTTSNISAHLYIVDAACYGVANGSALVIVDSGNAPYSYNWSDGYDAEFNEGLSAGQYSVTVTDFFGCEITLDVEITEPTLLTVDLYSPVDGNGFNISTYNGNDGQIDATVNGGTPEYEYFWSPTGDTTANVYGLEWAEFGYTVTVTDANRCTATATIILTQPLELRMPQGVSPNGDGDNDYFVIKGLEAYPDNSITIYNRWGNIVYLQNNYDNLWNGVNRNNEPLPDGTYFVILNVKNHDSLSGYIDLRRK